MNRGDLMRAGLFKASAPCLLLTGMMLAGCGGCWGPKPYPVDVTIEGAEDADLAGATVSFDDSPPQPIPNGHLKGQLNVKTGHKLTVAVALPATVVAKGPVKKTITLEELDGKPRTVRFAVQVEPKARPPPSYLLQFSDGCADQEVRVDGEKIGVFDGKGKFRGSVQRERNASIKVTVTEKDDCAARDCPLTLDDPQVLLDCPAPPKPEARITDVQPGPTHIRGGSNNKGATNVGTTTIYPPPPPPPPDHGGPGGSMQLAVQCGTGGMELVMDNKVVLPSCGPGATINVKGDGKSHTFQMHAPAGKECPNAIPIVRIIPKKGPLDPLIMPDCVERSCVDGAKNLLGAKQQLPEAKIQCLAGVPTSSNDYVEAQLLLAFAYDTQKKDATQAEAVLQKLVQTRRGSVSAEAQYRLAELLGRRKQYDQELAHAKEAWMNRRQLHGTPAGEVAMLGIQRLTAGALEGLFYTKGDKTLLERALTEYRQLEVAAKGVKGGEAMAKSAHEGVVRLEDQEKNSKVSLGN